MKFWLMAVTVVSLGSLSVAFLVYAGLPYSPLSPFGSTNPCENPYEPRPGDKEEVRGQAILQGRAADNNDGTRIILFLNGQFLPPVFITPPDGTFLTCSKAGDYVLQTTQFGWLSQTRQYSVIDEPIDLGIIKLLAGDADADEAVDSNDLQLFQQSLGQPPTADKFTDVNDDGHSDILDLAYAGMNLGQVGLPKTAGP